MRVLIPNYEFASLLCVKRSGSLKERLCLAVQTIAMANHASQPCKKSQFHTHARITPVLKYGVAASSRAPRSTCQTNKQHRHVHVV